MTQFEDEPLSPLDSEIEVLLGRLQALLARTPPEKERAIHEVAVRAIRERLRMLSRRCTDTTCRIRVIQEARKMASGDDRG